MPVRAPQHLRLDTRRWWRHCGAEWPLEAHHIKLLTIAAESWDRLTMAREIIDRDGMTFLDRLGHPRPRPEIAIERDCRISFMRAIRELDLDIAPPTQSTRPHALRSNRG